MALGVLDRRFFPAPSETLARLVELLQDGELVTATAITLRRMTVGFVLAAVPAVVIGLFMGASRTGRLVLSPLISALYPVPKIALVPMVVILFGLGETSKYVVVALSVFFLVVIHTMAGVLNVEERYFDIARNNGARGWDLIWTVAMPASLPNMLTGINLALGFALTVIVGTELLLPQGGLGALIWQSYNVYDIPTIFAGLIVVALLGWGFSTLMSEVERQLLPWRAQPTTRAGRRLEDEPRLRRFVRVWWLAIRPFSLTASVTPVVFGCVLAAYDGAWNWLLFAITLVGSVAIHAGTNLINDYYDWQKGTDTQRIAGAESRPGRGHPHAAPGVLGRRRLLCFRFRPRPVLGRNAWPIHPLAGHLQRAGRLVLHGRAGGLCLYRAWARSSCSSSWGRSWSWAAILCRCKA